MTGFLNASAYFWALQIFSVTKIAKFAVLEDAFPAILQFHLFSQKGAACFPFLAGEGLRGEAGVSSGLPLAGTAAQACARTASEDDRQEMEMPHAIFIRKSLSNKNSRCITALTNFLILIVPASILLFIYLLFCAGLKLKYRLKKLLFLPAEIVGSVKITNLIVFNRLDLQCMNRSAISLHWLALTLLKLGRNLFKAVVVFASLMMCTVL